MTTYHFVAGDAILFEEDGSIKQLGQRSNPSNHARAIRTSIVVYDNPAGEDIRYQWHRRKYKFNCPEHEHDQTFVVDLHTRDIHNYRPRFYFVRIEPSATLSPHILGYDYYDGASWQVANDDFPKHTSSIRMRMKLPYDNTMFSFVAVVYDARERREKKCDPQIGNGPPKMDKAPTALDLS